MTDIVFDDSDTMSVVAPVLVVQGHDVILDSPERRKRGGGPFRRALVHDQSDGLTLNFNNDYPGGITINGVKSLAVTGDLQFVISHHDELKVGGGNPPSEKVILSDIIKALRSEIKGLEARIAKLELRP